MTDAEWCRINGIAKNAFYSALKRLRKKAVELPTPTKGIPFHDLIAPVPQDVVKVTPVPDMSTISSVPRDPVRSELSADTHTIQIHLGSLEISMTNDADPALVAETIKLLRGVL
jgi:hypothetical protein